MPARGDGLCPAVGAVRERPGDGVPGTVDGNNGGRPATGWRAGVGARPYRRASCAAMRWRAVQGKKMGKGWQRPFPERRGGPCGRLLKLRRRTHPHNNQHRFLRLWYSDTTIVSSIGGGIVKICRFLKVTHVRGPVPAGAWPWACDDRIAGGHATRTPGGRVVVQSRGGGRGGSPLLSRLWWDGGKHRAQCCA
jgi:hypothetical protein